MGAGRSGSGGGSSSGGSRIARSLLNTDLQTQRDLLMPDISGTAEDIDKAQKIQKELSKNLYYYATQRDSDGNKVGKDVLDGLTKGTNNEINAYMKNYAERLSFGNDDLIPQKMNQIKATQKDLVERQNRVVEIMNSSNFKNAKWLEAPTVSVKNAGKTDFRNSLLDISKAYVDGKSAEYFKSSGYEDLTDKFFKK